MRFVLRPFRMIDSSLRICLGLSLCLVAGCGAPEEIRPQGDADAATSALVAALESWKAGNSPAESQAGQSVIWTDEDWKAGRKLSAYQLVGEPQQNGGHWRVYAELTLAESGKTSKPTQVCYAVTLGEPTSIIRSDFLN